MDLAQESFADRLDAAIVRKSSCLVVGLDPVVERLPPEVVGHIRSSASGAGFTGQAAAAFGEFLREVIERVAEFAVAVKPNTAYFERLGAAGWDVLRRVTEIARRHELLVILDAKRGDIGHTARAYAEGLLGDTPDTLGPSSDAVTLHAYTGRDGMEPWLERVRDGGKGLFVLVRTSNPSAAELQDLDSAGQPLYARVAACVREWGRDAIGACGLGSVGAVVGATAPEEGEAIRAILGDRFFLVPGFGAQGGRAEDLARLFLPGGRGVVVNASRAVLFPERRAGEGWADAVERAARDARDQIEEVRQSVG